MTVVRRSIDAEDAEVESTRVGGHSHDGDSLSQTPWHQMRYLELRAAVTDDDGNVTTRARHRWEFRWYRHWRQSRIRGRYQDNYRSGSGDNNNAGLMVFRTGSEHRSDIPAFVSDRVDGDWYCRIYDFDADLDWLVAMSIGRPSEYFYMPARMLVPEASDI